MYIYSSSSSSSMSAEEIEAIQDYVKYCMNI